MKNKMFNVELHKYIEKFTNWTNKFSKIKKLSEDEQSNILLELQNNNPINMTEAREILSFFIYVISKWNKKEVFDSFEGFVMWQESVVADVVFFWLCELSLDENLKETKLTHLIKEEYGI